MARSIALRKFRDKHSLANWQMPKNWSENTPSKTETQSSSKNKDSIKKRLTKGTEVEKIIVRRTNFDDVPIVLNYVKMNAKNSWPHLISNRNPSTKVVMTDMVTRILSQGHSYIAQNNSLKKEVKGLALSALLCPWDAIMVEKFASCLRCPATKKLMTFTAYCMKAPNLHNKYKVHSLMQVTLVIPETTKNLEEIVQALAKQTIEHGRRNQIPLVRFDVTNDKIAEELEKFRFKKEWEVPMKVLPPTMKVTPCHRRVVKKAAPIENKIVSEDKSVFRVFSAIPTRENIIANIKKLKNYKTVSKNKTKPSEEIPHESKKEIKDKPKD